MIVPSNMRNRRRQATEGHKHNINLFPTGAAPPRQPALQARVPGTVRTARNTKHTNRHSFGVAAPGLRLKAATHATHCAEFMATRLLRFRPLRSAYCTRNKGDVTLLHYSQPGKTLTAVLTNDRMIWMIESRVVCSSALSMTSQRPAGRVLVGPL